MTTIGTVYDDLQGMAPFQLQLGFDNSGFLVGHREQEVTKILVSLDITSQVVEEAAQMGAQLIVSHHPVIWGGAKSITDQTTTGQIILTLAEKNIGAICAHTNLDAVTGGVNDALAQALGLTQIDQLHQDGVDANGNPYGIGRVGVVEEQSVANFAAHVKKALNAGCVRYVDGGKPVRRVAVGGGSCGDMLVDAIAAGCDTFVTADVKYDVFLAAKAQGVNLLDAGHYPTEQVICPVLQARLSQKFPKVQVILSKSHREVYRCL